MTVKRTTKAKAFSLPGGKVRVRYVLKQHGNITDKRHVAYGGKLDDAMDNYVAQMSPTKKGAFVSIFTEEEEEYLEDRLALEKGDLNPNKSDGFYNDIRVSIGKSGKLLDLSQAEDYVEYKVLLSYENKVSPDIFTTPLRKTYNYEMVRESDVTQKATKRLNYNKEAYKILGRIGDSREQLTGAYRVLKNKRVSNESSMEWLEAQVGQLIDDDAKRFVEVLTDPLYESKLFIEQAIDHGAIKRLKGLYYTTDGIELSQDGESPTLINAITFLDSVENQDLKLALELKMK